MSDNPTIEIVEQTIPSTDEPPGKFAILRCLVGVENPTAAIDDAVTKYVGEKGYNEFVEIHLDNPWIRIVVGGINRIKFGTFKDQKL